MTRCASGSSTASSHEETARERAWSVRCFTTATNPSAEVASIRPPESVRHLRRARCIGGEAATGTGRSLVANAGSPQGLSVLVTATQSEVSGAGGSLSLGDVVISSGMMGALDGFLDLAEGAGGKIARARDTWKAQITLADDRIEILEERIERREALLLKQFAALETAMATLSSQAAWLAAQLGTQNGNQ